MKLGEVLFESGAASIPEIEQLLTEAKSHVFFNSSAFRVNVLEARVAQARGDVERRRVAARAALDLAGSGPQFQRHPTVGLVDAPPPLVAELQALAGT